MYEKKEEFNFVIDKTHVKLEVHFELNESDVIFEFRKDCAFVNAQHPERKNNCEMSIGEITHLAAIFLYESVVELIRQKRRRRQTFGRRGGGEKVLAQTAIGLESQFS